MDLYVELGNIEDSISFSLMSKKTGTIFHISNIPHDGFNELIESMQGERELEGQNPILLMIYGNNYLHGASFRMPINTDIIPIYSFRVVSK